MHSAQLDQLKDSISDLHSEIAQAHKDKNKAANLREKEAEAYKQSKMEWDKTLQELKRQLRSEIPSKREAASKAEEEITLKQVKAENKEEDAQFKFKKLDSDMAVAIARKTKDVELKERKVVSMTHDISQSDGDFKMSKEELAAAKEYAEQINSLKEAYGILSGDDIPLMS